MTNRPTDRLWPLSELSPERRAEIRATIAADPTWLDNAILASLINGESAAERMLVVIREARCPAS